MEKKKEEIKLEIEFYKDLSTKAFTADILVAGGTVTLLQRSYLLVSSRHIYGLLSQHFVFYIFKVMETENKGIQGVER